jgi:hypothetical protein
MSAMRHPGRNCGSRPVSQQTHVCVTPLARWATRTYVELGQSRVPNHYCPVPFGASGVGPGAPHRSRKSTSG